MRIAATVVAHLAVIRFPWHTSTQLPVITLWRKAIIGGNVMAGNFYWCITLQANLVEAGPSGYPPRFIYGEYVNDNQPLNGPDANAAIYIDELV